MAHRYVIDQARGLVTVVFSGEISATDVAEYLVTLRDDPEYRREFSEFVDLSEVQRSSINAADFERLGGLDPFSKASRRAFVAPQDSLFGMCRMYELVSELPNLRAFRTHAEAMEWLRP